jgi:hypothetical protein
VTKRTKTAAVAPEETPLDLSHLRRETRTALELAVLALAPSDLVDRLPTAAGLFEAILELPPNSQPVVAFVPKLVKRSRAALDEWHRWEAERLAKVKA